MDNYGYIYKTTNLINGRPYIGQKKGLFKLNYLGSGKLIIRAIKKYGKQNFKVEVLAFATTKDMLDSLEIKYIYEHRQVFGKFLYNITKGGEGGQTCLGTIHMFNKEQSKMVRIEEVQQYKELGWIEGRNDEFKKIMKEALTGRKHSENCNCCGCRSSREYVPAWNNGLTKKTDVRMANRKSCTGDKCSNYGRICIHNLKLGKEKHIKPELLQQYKDIGWIEGRPEDTNRKVSRNYSGGISLNKNYKRIYNLELNKRKTVPSIELKNYLLNGWLLGMGKLK